jgi:hypothetical protein
VKLLDRLRTLVWRSDDMKLQLFAFLGGDKEELKVLGGRLTREDARRILQELIPARVEVRGVCTGPLAAVAAAPHVSFDNWSEYFCNRVARRLRIGWVVAKNFRDQHGPTIPVSIGRHIHVNRPTESIRYGADERETPRSRAAFEEYLAAIARASGRSRLPVDLLIEFHSHHRTPFLEIATSGLGAEAADVLLDRWNGARTKWPSLPELKMEPLHDLSLTAEGAKWRGSIRSEVAGLALHVEIPREARQSDESRHFTCAAIVHTIRGLLVRMRAARL